MTFEIFMLYFLTRLDSVHNLLDACIVIFCVVYFCCSVFYMFLTLDSVRETDPQVVIVKKLFSYKWIFGIIVVLNLLLPSKEEVLFIVAGTGIIELAKNEKVSEVAGNAFDVVNNYLENMKKEQEPKK